MSTEGWVNSYTSPRGGRVHALEKPIADRLPSIRMGHPPIRGAGSALAMCGALVAPGPFRPPWDPNADGSCGSCRRIVRSRR